MKRRDFIKISTSASGGLMLNFMTPALALAKDKSEHSSFSPHVIAEIHADNSVTFFFTFHEMGQGSSTGIPMVFCDELGADWDQMKVIMPSRYNPEKYGGWQGGTGGSGTIMDLWPHVRSRAASIRELLISSAAKKWQIDTNGLIAEGGFVVNSGNGAKFGFGELIDIAKDLEPIDPKTAPLKSHKDFKYIGKPLKNRITPKIITGQKYFSLDMKLPGMRYASVERCPVYRGKIDSFDDSEARKIKGVIDVIKVPEIYKDAGFIVREGVAVVATSTWAALQGRKALKINWANGKNANRNSDTLRAEMEALEKVSREIAADSRGVCGDITSAKAEADEVLTATYENPFHAHACMEPMNAIARYENGKCEMWAPTQRPNSAREMLVEIGIPEADQIMNVTPSGGSFGRKFYGDHIVETAYIAKTFGGTVMNMWTREDDIQMDYQAPFRHDVSEVTIKDGEVTGWHSKVITTAGGGRGNLWLPYIIPNRYAERHGVDSPATTGAWRSVGVHKEAFGNEGMIDEVAHHLKKDPLQFRLDMLNKPIDSLNSEAKTLYQQERSQIDVKLMETVLKEVANMVDWGKRLPKRHGQGVAAYRFGRSYCAQVVEVGVIDGGLKVKRVNAAIHCGTAVNPHLIKGQIEGSIIWALTSVLYGGMTLEKGMIKESNFHDYRMLRMNEIPEINVHIIPSTDAAKGVGEPGVPPLTPALMNAIFAATGKRIRKTPLDVAELI